MAYPNNNARMINQPASTHYPGPPVYNCFNHQAGYAVQEPGRAQYGHFGQYNLYQRPPFPSSSLPHVMRDTIQREIEKERVREQIIMSEIANRRTLEAEIRRELMLFERELAQRREKKALLFELPPVSGAMVGELARQRESNTLLLGLPPASGRKEGELAQQRKGDVLLLGMHPVSGPREGTVAEGMSVHEKVALSSEQKEALNAVSCEMRLPFQRGPVVLKSPEKKETLNAVRRETLPFQIRPGVFKSPEKKELLNAASRETLPFQRGPGYLKSPEKKETLNAVNREMFPFQIGPGVFKSPEKKESLNAVSCETMRIQRGAGDLKYPRKTETLNAVTRETFLFHKGAAGDLKSPQKKESMNAASHETLPVQKEGGDLKSSQEKETLGAISRGTLPFQYGAGDLKVSEVKPINNATEKQKEVKIDLPAKPNTNISGLKRKTVTPPLPDSKNPSGSKFNKKAKRGWSCGLCQVKVTSESTLQMHLSGKKHKMMEESLQTQITRTIGSLSKTPVANNIVEIATDSLLSAKNDGLLANPKLGNLNEKVDTVPNVRKNVDPKKPYNNFWCNMCKVGPMTKNNMDAHKIGKKHAKQLKGVKTGKPGK